MLEQKTVRRLAISLALVIAAGIAEITGHRDASSSAAAGSSDESEVQAVGREEKGVRRSLYKQEWQYEGLPIEFPVRRYNEIKDQPTKIDTKGNRHSVIQHEPQYDSLSVDMPSRRHLEFRRQEVKETTTTTTSIEPTTFAPKPPMDPRYRRIYNPDETATIDQYPFMAALLVNGELWCGAVVIARDSVLTAAHCLQLQYNNRFFREYVKMLTVRVGSTNVTHGGDVVRVSDIFFHPNYKPQTLEFNVALMKVHKNLTFGREEPKIDMIQYATNKIVPVDNKVIFLGWGSVLGVGGIGGHVLLQKLELPVYDLADCQEVYGRELVTRNNFCAGYITIPKNVCNHDAGGPAIMDGVLIGILSFSSKRCDQVDQPAVFSKIGAFASWLEGLGENKMQLRHIALKVS